MTDDTLSRLAALEAEATPGPWTALTTGSEGCSVIGPGRPQRVARLTAKSLDECRGDAALIVSARNLFPESLALVEAIRALHEPEGWLDGGGYGSIYPACRTCGTSDEYAVPWPCATRAALDAWFAEAGRTE